MESVLIVAIVFGTIFGSIFGPQLLRELRLLLRPEAKSSPSEEIKALQRDILQLKQEVNQLRADHNEQLLILEQELRRVQKRLSPTPDLLSLEGKPGEERHLGERRTNLTTEKG